MVTSQKVRPKRSVKLTSAQKKLVKETLDSSETKTDAAIKLGVSREVLERMILHGSCSEKTYIKLFGKESLPATD